MNFLVDFLLFGLELMKPERLSRTTIYESEWVNLYVDQVRFPNGRIIERHHLLDFDHPAVIVFIEDEHDRVLFVRVCRYPTLRTDWEIPAGGMEASESILEAAQREVREETGYTCHDYQMVYTYYPMNGIANKLFHIVRCKATAQVADFDANEVSEIRWLEKAEIRQMLKEQSIVDGPTLTALLLCL
jgi:ADP-ribose pyrophosphatase